MYLNKKIILVLVLLASLCGLATFAYLNKDKIFYSEVSFDRISGWENQDFVKLKYTFMNNCTQLQRFYKKRKFDEHFGTLEQWKGFCEGIVALPNNNKAIKSYFENLQLVEIRQFNKQSLFTGYYSPLLHGSYEKTERYNYPLYRRPADLIEANLKDFMGEDPKYRFKKIFARVEGNKIKPYYTRKQIDKNNQLSNDDVLVWVDSKVDAFFLHIQGSGEVQLEDGRIINVGYAGQNGQKYYAVGRYLVKKGWLTKEEVSLQSIRKFLEENPDKIEEVLYSNPSYIFFTEKADGPYGAFGNVLTKEHSVAIDRNFVPLGIPLFIDTKVTATGEDFKKMVFSQDIGGAIKGAVRADIFFGADETAEYNSGKQNQEGKMYVFSAKNL